MAKIYGNTIGVGGGSDIDLEPKKVTPTKEQQEITPATKYDGFATVIVEPIPDEYIMPSGTATIVTNGTHDVRALESITVSVMAGDATPYNGAVTIIKREVNA